MLLVEEQNLTKTKSYKELIVGIYMYVLYVYEFYRYLIKLDI